MKDFIGCFHHHCSICKKNTVEAGGMLYRCSICPWAWCYECLPTGNSGFRYLDTHQRWEDLGFDTSKNSVYIHCSEDCEMYAKKEFNWKPEKIGQSCPNALDVSYNFGVNAMQDHATAEMDKKPAAREVSSTSSSSSEEDG